MKDVTEILEMKLGEFASRYRDELPRYIVVGEDVTFKNIVNVLSKSIDYGDKGVEVIVVVDRHQKPIGIIEDLELLEILSPHRRWTLSILKPPIRKKAKDIRDILNIPIGRIARMNHPVLRHDSTIKDAIDLMDSLKTRYVIVTDEKDRLYAVLSSRVILSKIFEKLVRR